MQHQNTWRMLSWGLGYSKCKVTPWAETLDKRKEQCLWNPSKTQGQHVCLAFVSPGGFPLVSMLGTSVWVSRAASMGLLASEPPGGVGSSAGSGNGGGSSISTSLVLTPGGWLGTVSLKTAPSTPLHPMSRLGSQNVLLSLEACG